MYVVTDSKIQRSCGQARNSLSCSVRQAEESAIQDDEDESRSAVETGGREYFEVAGLLKE